MLLVERDFTSLRRDVAGIGLVLLVFMGIFLGTQVKFGFCERVTVRVNFLWVRVIVQFKIQQFGWHIVVEKKPRVDSLLVILEIVEILVIFLLWLSKVAYLLVICHLGERLILIGFNYLATHIVFLNEPSFENIASLKLRRQGINYNSDALLIYQFFKLFKLWIIFILFDEFQTCLQLLVVNENNQNYYKKDGSLQLQKEFIISFLSRVR